MPTLSHRSPARFSLVYGRLSLVVLVVAALGSSCFPGPKPPEATPSGTLGVRAGEAAGGALANAPFAVVHQHPVGEAEDASDVSVVFSRPMRALELAENVDPSPPVTIEGLDGSRIPPGQWRWLGSSALTFQPSTPFPRASHYRVSVPVGTRALDGSVLGEACRFEFTTPRPTLVRTEPAEGSNSLRPTSQLDLFFDQPVALDAVEKHVHLAVTSGRGPAQRVAFKASLLTVDGGSGTPSPTSSSPSPPVGPHAKIRVRPTSPLPVDAALTLEIDDALPGIEGPRPAAARANHYRTYGPLTVKRVDCYRDTPNKRCAREDGVRLEFANRIKLRDLARSVSFEPPVRIDWNLPPMSEGSGGDDWMSDISIPARLAAATSYRVLLKGGLKDEFGQSLVAPGPMTIETDDEWPDFEVGLVGSVLDAPKRALPTIPVATVNASTLDVAAATFDESSFTKFIFESDHAPTYERVAALAGAHRQTVRFDGPRNARVVKSIDLATALGKRVDHGLAALAVRGPKRGESQSRVATLATTDLGITAKLSRFGSLVWVTSLTAAKPVAGAAVTIRARDGREVFGGVTDKDGLVRVPSDRYDPSPAADNAHDGLVFARLGDDLAVRRVRDMLSPYRFNDFSDPEGRLDPIGFVFTDRGVYRPGETIRAKGLFRVPTARGTENPAGRAVVIRGIDGEGEAVFEAKAKLGEFGDVSVDVPIPSATHLGSFEVRAELERTGGAGKDNDEVSRSASAHVELAAYKPSEFSVHVEPERPAYIRGDRATFVTRGDYLFGAPMSGGKVHVSIRRGPGTYALPISNAPGSDDAAFVWSDDAFSVDHRERASRSESLSAQDGALGADGRYPSSVVLTLPESGGTETVRAESEVEDLTRQTVAAEASAIVHPGEFYVALKSPPSMFVDEGTAVAADLLAVEPSGARRAGVTVKVELVKRTWTNVWRGAGESEATNESRVRDVIVDTCNVTTRATTAACKVTPKSSGYHLIHASAKDPRGNVVSASYGTYVLAGAGADKSAAAPPWSNRDAAVVDLVTDKTSYDVGDVATVLVKSPFSEAEALVTVERAGVSSTERTTLRGPTPTLKIPVTRDMAPNAFVGVHLLRGRTKERPDRGADVGAPAYRLGYARISIRPEDRRLKVSVTPSAREFRPGQDVDLDVAVADRHGAPVRATATIYAVDEGVLMLTGYRTPDPLPTFTAPRPLAVFTLESREDLARIFRLGPGALGADKGGDGGGGGAGVRADFRATAFFQPSLLVERGHAKVRFRLPDSLSTFRIMAVVADAGDRFGFADSQVVTSRRLMLRPALPRFFRTGDVVDAGVIVSTKGLPKSTIDVSLEATGLTVEGETKKRVTLDAAGLGSQAEVRFRLRPTQAGAAVLTFRASGGRESDALRLEKRIEIPTTLEAVALAGETQTAQGEALGDLRAMRTDVGGLELNLSSSALAGLDGAVRQVLEYPYGCTEQLTSRVIPLVLAAELLPLVGAAPPPNARQIIDDAIGKIIAAQKSDGSFGYWVDSPRGDLWLTAYVAWALGEARSKGYGVPAHALELALTRLRSGAEERARALKQAGEENSTTSLAEASFIADVLAASGTPDAGLQSALFGARTSLPLFARALLAHALAFERGKPPPAPRVELARELLRDIDNHLRVTPTGAMVVSNHGDAYAPLLDSDARTTAMVLRALLTANPSHPLASRLARGLVDSRNGGAFRSTQEAAWALVALDAYRRAREGAPPEFDARVFLGDRLLKEHHFSTRSAFGDSVSADELLQVASAPRGAGRSDLTFQMLGSGRLYYEARLRYALRDLPTSALERGLFVRKTMRAVQPEAIPEALRSSPTKSTNVFTASDLVLVDLHLVSTAPRDQVVLDDALPAGFEALDARLATTSSLAASVDNSASKDPESEDEDDRDQGDGATSREGTGFHREVRDDRVLTFIEHLPAGVFHYRYLARATSRGTFLVPATRAECMYAPEVFGRTAGQTVEVK